MEAIGDVDDAFGGEIEMLGRRADGLGQDAHGDAAFGGLGDFLGPGFHDAGDDRMLWRQPGRQDQFAGAGGGREAGQRGGCDGGQKGKAFQLFHWGLLPIYAGRPCRYDRYLEPSGQT